MLKRLCAVAAFVAMAAVPVAHADGQGIFVQVGAGHATAHDGNTTWSVNGGYRWTIARDLYLGAEVGYQDLGTTHARSSLVTTLTDLTGTHTLTSEGHGHASTDAVTVGANLRWDFSDSVYFTAHGGAARYRLRERVQGTGTLDGVAQEPFHDAYNVYDSRWYAGAGFGFNFTPQLSLQLMYDHYPQHYDIYGYRFSENADVYSSAIEYRF